MSNKLYDRLKFIAQIALPALGTLYVTLAALWDLPKPQEVAGTVLAVDTFLGVLLGLQAASYGKGVIQAGHMNVVSLESGGKNFSLDLDHEPEELEDATEVRFKVKKKRAPRKRKMGEVGLTTIELLLICTVGILLVIALIIGGAFH